MSAKYAAVSGIPESISTKFAETIKPLVRRGFWRKHEVCIYNYERVHQRRNMNDRTPYQVFVEGIPTTNFKEDLTANFCIHS